MFLFITLEKKKYNKNQKTRANKKLKVLS